MLIAPKKDMLKQIAGYSKEVGRPEKTVKTDGTPKPAITCYNYQKPGYMARKCPELMTNKHKRYLSNIIKELIKAESGNDNL